MRDPHSMPDQPGGPGGQNTPENSPENTAENAAASAPQPGTNQAYDERLPYNQQARQTEESRRRTDQQPANEDDPIGTNEIPTPSTGEARWVREQTGALGSMGGQDWTNQVGTVTGPGTPGLVSQSGGESGQGEWPPVGQDQNQYVNPEEYAIQGNMMDSGQTIEGAPFAGGTPPGPPAGNEGFQEGGIEGPPNEAYGQGKTRQYTPLGAEPGIVQQEVLQSQQYQREERRSRQGILGVVGDMLGGLFGNAKRTPNEDEGEEAGEAHP